MKSEKEIHGGVFLGRVLNRIISDAVERSWWWLGSEFAECPITPYFHDV